LITLYSTGHFHAQSGAVERWHHGMLYKAVPTVKMDRQQTSHRVIGCGTAYARIRRIQRICRNNEGAPAGMLVRSKDWPTIRLAVLVNGHVTIVPAELADPVL